MKSLIALTSLAIFPVAVAAPGFVIDTPTGPRTDSLVFQQVVYTGACPGTSIDPVRGYFFDPGIPTLPGRRVRVVNVTPGMSGDPFPFTDREYQSGGRSEKIDFLPSSRHRQRWFSVAEGMNDFEVTVTDGGRVVDTKQFAFPVTVMTRYEGRWPSCRVENDCHTNPNGGVYCVPRTVCSCIYN
ncbi:MAG: hypothetical protein ACO3A4_02945 [Silvanigrellaceae bacterium]